MHVWDYRNRRHRGLARKPPRPQAYASTFVTRDGQQHERVLQDEEIRRQELEDAEVDIKQEEVRRLLMDYMDGPGGKQELDEVADNLRHWKDNCNALGYDSDGEQLSLATTPADGSEEENEAAQRRAERKNEERGERSRRRKAREVFDMFDADGSRTISTSEMKALLQEMCIPMKRAQLKELMREIDTDGSGEVDFDEFYQWYKVNAAAARNADKTQTVGLFATKLVKGLTGFTFRMEALRIIVAHAQAQVEKRERERFRLTRPPRLVCDPCGETFASTKEQRRHLARSELYHEAWAAAKREASGRFHPVACILDHTAPPPVEGASTEPHRSPDAPTARKKRLRRLVFSDKFYILYGGVGWGGMGSGDQERVEETRWVNKPHPRLADPDDRRGDQLRRGQSVEGIDPSDARAKVPLEVTSGGLVPSWGGVRRGRVMRRVAGRGTTGLQHVLLRLAQEKARATNVFMAEDALARAKVPFRWEGWSSQQVTLHAEFNCFKEEGMGEDQTEGHIGHEVCHYLSPGAYKYYFMVNGRRRVDECLPVVGDESKGEDLFNVVTVTNQHLGEEGELALSIPRPHCHHSQQQQQQQEQQKQRPTATNRIDKDADQTRQSQEQKRDDNIDQPTATEVAQTGPGEPTPSRESAEIDAGAFATSTTPEAATTAMTWTRPLTRIDLSRHQISDDGAAALALALRHNVRVEELILSFNRVSGAGVAALASFLGDSRCRVLRLSLSQNGVGRRGGEHLGKMLQGGEGGGHWGQVPCLRKLNLADNMLGDDGVEGVAAGLVGHPCLETLILDGNDIGLDGTQSLCDSLLQNKSLRTLALRRNSLLADSAERLGRMLLRNGAIETLDLAYNPVGPEGLRRLSDFLFKNTRLERLGLRGCDIQPDGVKSGVYFLAQGLVANRAVTSLDLAANELDEYAGQELAHALLKNRTLTALDLTGNYVPEEWLRENHQVCSEVYGILPSLVESLRLNRARNAARIGNGTTAGGGGAGAGDTENGGRLSPRTAHLEKVVAREARAAERQKRLDKRRKREEARRHHGSRQRRRRQHHYRGRRRAKDEGGVGLRQDDDEKKHKIEGGEGALPGEGDGEARASGGRRGERCVLGVGSTDAEQQQQQRQQSQGKRRRWLPLGGSSNLIESLRGGRAANAGVSRTAGGDASDGGAAADTFPRQSTRSPSPPSPPPPPLPPASPARKGRGGEEGPEEEKKRRKRPKRNPTAAAAATDTSKDKTHGTSSRHASTAASPSSTTAAASTADVAAAEGEAGNGVRRVPGVWTRRGVWAAANELAEGRARVGGKRMGDRQRQLQEDEAVRKAGAAKREELVGYLSTLAGETLAARTAKLLVHAERQEVREAERITKAELQASQLRRKQAEKHPHPSRKGSDTATTTAHSTGGGVLPTLTLTRTRWLTGLWASTTTKTLALGEEEEGGANATTATINNADATVHPLARSAKPPAIRGREAAAAATTMTAGWDALSEDGQSQATLGVESLASTGTASSLPSAAAIVAMEEEDEEEVKRALGSLREDKKAWDLKNRPPFLRAFGRFDPEGSGNMLASDIGDLMAQLLLPEAVRPEEVEAVTTELVKVADQDRKAEKISRERAARRSGLHQTPPAPRPFTIGSGEKTVGIAHIWRWHRREHLNWKPSFKAPSRRELRRLASQQRRRERTGEISRDWAKRVILVVGEREARLRAAEVFRGREPPRFVCPLCHEFGCSTAEGLDEHLRETAWHGVNAALQERFEENADIVAVARRAGGADSFPEYFHIARDMPEETELQVHEEASEISRPLGTIMFDMLVLALGEEGDWLKINFESHRGVYVKHTTTSDPRKGHPRRRVVMTRMALPPARSAAKVAAATVHLSATTAGTMTSTLLKPVTLAASGLSTLGHATMSTLNALAYTLHHGGASSPPPEPEPLAPGMAVFKPRVVRFVLPRVFCHAAGLPAGAMLKVRTEPGGVEGKGNGGGGGGGGFEGDPGDDGATGGVEGGGSHVLGRVGANQCVIGLATSGDWLQVRYKKYEAAWMLMVYRDKKLLAPLADVHPGVVVVITGDGGGSGGNSGRGWAARVKGSPFPMPREVLERKEVEEKQQKAAAAAVAAASAELGRSKTVVGALDDGAIYG